MAKFLVLYRSSVSASDQLAGATPEQVKAGMDAWMEWAQRRGDAVVDLGVPLGEARRIDPESVAPSSSQVAGYSILQADSLEGAVELLRDHPHLHTPGDSSIEVLEFLAMPGM